MNNSRYSKEELDDFLLNRVPRELLHQVDGIFCIATLFAFFSKKRRERLEKKQKLLIISQEEEIQV